MQLQAGPTGNGKRQEQPHLGTNAKIAVGRYISIVGGVTTPPLADRPACASAGSLHTHKLDLSQLR
eukprot:2485475-Amphidinium_carterae.1